MKALKINFLKMISKNKYFYFTSFLFVCLVFVFSAQGVLAGVAKLTWNANSASENITGYEIHYGNAPGSYSTTVNAGNVTTYTINNISNTGTTYFALKAINASGSSPFSNEVKKTPGDVDKSGKVDLFDFNALKTNFGSTGDNAADINLDGKVDLFDFNALKGNFGAQG